MQAEVIYPTLYNPSAPDQPYFNVPQLDSSQLRTGGEFIWRRSSGGRLAGIPLRAGVYRNRSLLPQSSGGTRLGIGVTTGAGVLLRQISLDVAYGRESIGGQTGEFPMAAFSGFSESRQEDGLETTVFHQFLFSATVRF